jgi:hypothetical protein
MCTEGKELTRTLAVFHSIDKELAIYLFVGSYLRSTIAAIAHCDYAFHNIVLHVCLYVPIRWKLV